VGYKTETSILQDRLMLFYLANTTVIVIFRPLSLDLAGWSQLYGGLDADVCR